MNKYKRYHFHVQPYTEHTKKLPQPCLIGLIQSNFRLWSWDNIGEYCLEALTWHGEGRVDHFLWCLCDGFLLVPAEKDKRCTLYIYRCLATSSLCIPCPAAIRSYSYWRKSMIQVCVQLHLCFASFRTIFTGHLRGRFGFFWGNMASTAFGYWLFGEAITTVAGVVFVLPHTRICYLMTWW